MSEDSRRRQIDLMKLPVVWRYTIALVIVAIVVTLVFLVGKGQGREDLAMPVLVWLGVLVLLSFARNAR